MGHHGDPHGPHGGARGAPMGPIWAAGLPAGWKSSFHFSKCYFSQTETQNLATDLANGVSECILDPFSPLLQTILYRTDRRRAHHLPPDPNIFNGHNRFLLNWPFSGGSKILIFPRPYFWQRGGRGRMGGKWGRMGLGCEGRGGIPVGFWGDLGNLDEEEEEEEEEKEEEDEK